MKIVIIGAGHVGATIAYTLATGGIASDVSLIDLDTDKAYGEILDIAHGGAVSEQVNLRAEGYDAVFLGVGAPLGVGLGIRGDDAEGITDALNFLRVYNLRGSVPVGKDVVVIGGGNSAIDAARTALLLGAETVSVVYRRSREAMPAYEEEIEEAELEGVTLKLLTAPVEIVVEGRKVAGVRCVPMRLGEFDRSGRRRPEESGSAFVIKADQVLVAIGQSLDLKKIAGEMSLETRREFIQSNPVTGQTSEKWIFAGGDAVSGPSSVVEAVAAGERAAVGIDLYLTGQNHAFWREMKPVDTQFDPAAEPVDYAREKMELIPLARRRNNFDEVEIPWREPVALRQAKRCLRCDYGKRTCTAAEPSQLPIVDHN